MDWHKALDIQGWMEEPDLHWLYEQAKKMDTIVEIGSWKGRSTTALCAGCKGMVYAVDHFLGSPTPWGWYNNHLNYTFDGTVEYFNLQKDALPLDEPYEEFLKNTKGLTNLKVLKMTSKAAAASGEIPEKVDMVFLDSNHTFQNTLDDLGLWHPRATKLICGHDYSEPWTQVAVAQYFKFYGEQHDLASKDIWFQNKINLGG